MKILKTFGESAAAAEMALQKLEQRGATNTAKVDAVVQDILAAVQRRGDEAVREFASSLDSLAEDQPLLVSREEMQSRVGVHQRGTEGRHASRPGEYTRLRREAASSRVDLSPIGRDGGWSDCAPPRISRLLCPRRALSAAFNSVDDRNARSSRGCRTHRRLLA